MIKPNTTPCPACGVPLKVDHNSSDPRGQALVWCGSGPCPSPAANRGAQAATLARAFGDLREAIETEGTEILFPIAEEVAP